MGAFVRPFAVLAVLLLAGYAPAQVAHSAHWELLAFSLDGTGGGSGSLDVSAQASLADAAGGPLTAGNLTAHVGFLAAAGQTDGTVPVLFGIQPPFGPKAGGTALSLSGLHFDQLGSVASLRMTIGAAHVDDLVLHSESLITATAPPGSSGAQDIEVWGNLGSVMLPRGYLYTPAVVTTPVVPIGGQLEVRNYGPAGGQFLTLCALTTAELPTKFGTLLIGPALFHALPADAYPPAGGVTTKSLEVPADVSLHGLTLHFQSLCIAAPPAPEAVLTNASETRIP